MHNPPHPGEFLTAVYLEPNGLSARELAVTLDASASTLRRILKGQSGISPDMALRLSKALGRSPESWLAAVPIWPLASQAACQIEPGRQGPADYGVMHPLILRLATPF
jgi:addiction module HigA family antidote|nr:HigA family addiction module antitoxin [Acidiferrobacter thiooxydans]